MFTVADAMTANPVTIRDTDHLAIAESLMRSGLQTIRHLPVLSRGRLVGVLTQRDLLRAGLGGPEAERRGKAPVAGAMSKRVRTVRPGTPLRRAVAALLKDKLGGLPVVDAEGTVVGILTETDVLRFALRLLAGLDRYAASRRGARAAQAEGLLAELGLPHHPARPAARRARA